MTDVSLSTNSVVVAFGGLRALDGVSLAFPQGRITGLIGPNGSGKSTLVNTMCGQIRPSGGTIRLGDEDITRMRPDLVVKKGVARTYQIPRVPSELTVEEIISVPMNYGASGRPAKVAFRDPRAIAEFCSLGPLTTVECRNLSVTEMRRLEIARALACGPSVLLLDEVMAGLSHEDSVSVMSLVSELHKSGITIIIIEHLMRVITTLCHTVFVLNNGRLLAEGEPKAVLADEAVREAYLGKGFKL
ncbi:MAG: ABC transporter ATP-binding protein [Rhizobiaceae bacterium]